MSSCIAIFKLHNEEVLLFNAVKYRAALVDGTVVAETPEEGIEFYVKDGIFICCFDLMLLVVVFVTLYYLCVIV